MGEAPSNSEFTPPPEIPKNHPFVGLTVEDTFDPTVQDSVFKRADQLMRSDRRFWEIVQEESLIFLLTIDRDWFFENYTGERDSKGHLVGKDGKITPFFPSSNITGGLGRVFKIALEKYDASSK